MKTRILFVCGRNQWRSPTAERVFRRDPRLDVRARGLSQISARRLAYADLTWADLVFVMEHSHKSRLRDVAVGNIRPAQVHVLEIPDEFQFMDPELVALLRERVSPYLAHL